MPNVAAPYLIMLTAFLGQAILVEASLSFLGLGVAEPTAAWGLMLKGAAVEFAERVLLDYHLPRPGHQRRCLWVLIFWGIRSGMSWTPSSANRPREVTKGGKQREINKSGSSPNSLIEYFMKTR